jgi:hypothetical protein
VLKNAEMPPARELHVIGIYHFHYFSLLDHFSKHVLFIKDTPNPAMDALSELERISSQELLYRECDNLLNEIARLHSELNMQKQRLKNVMALVSYIALVPNYSNFDYIITVIGIQSH